MRATSELRSEIARRKKSIEEQQRAEDVGRLVAEHLAMKAADKEARLQDALAEVERLSELMAVKRGNRGAAALESGGDHANTSSPPSTVVDPPTKPSSVPRAAPVQSKPGPDLRSKSKSTAPLTSKAPHTETASKALTPSSNASGSRRKHAKEKEAEVAGSDKDEEDGEYQPSPPKKSRKNKARALPSDARDDDASPGNK